MDLSVDAAMAEALHNFGWRSWVIAQGLTQSLNEGRGVAVERQPNVVCTAGIQCQGCGKVEPWQGGRAVDKLQGEGRGINVPWQKGRGKDEQSAALGV